MTSPAFDTADLAAAVDTQLRLAVARLREQAHGAHLYAIAVGMVEDLTGFFVTGQTLEAADEAPGDAASRAYHWWAPSEWSLSFDDPDEAAPGRVTAPLWALTGTDLAVAGTGAEVDDDTYEAIRAAYERIVVDALVRLRSEGELRTASGEPVWAWVHHADAHDEDIDDVSFSEIQADAALAEKFALRFGTRPDSLTAVIAERIAALG
jgi:hypothetical protein